MPAKLAVCPYQYGLGLKVYMTRLLYASGRLKRNGRVELRDSSGQLGTCFNDGSLLPPRSSVISCPNQYLLGASKPHLVSRYLTFGQPSLACRYPSQFIHSLLLFYLYQIPVRYQTCHNGFSTSQQMRARFLGSRSPSC